MQLLHRFTRYDCFVNIRICIKLNGCGNGLPLVATPVGLNEAHLQCVGPTGAAGISSTSVYTCYWLVCHRLGFTKDLTLLSASIEVEISGISPALMWIYYTCSALKTHLLLTEGQLTLSLHRGTKTFIISKLSDYITVCSFILSHQEQQACIQRTKAETGFHCMHFSLLACFLST